FLRMPTIYLSSPYSSFIDIKKPAKETTNDSPLQINGLHKFFQKLASWHASGSTQSIQRKW
ncbi:MAG: hypothetical protein ACTS8S_23940, partial [Giesbergeria sp.]